MFAVWVGEALQKEHSWYILQSACMWRGGERSKCCVKAKEARRGTRARIRPEGFSVTSCLDLSGSCALERAQAS